MSGQLESDRLLSAWRTEVNIGTARAGGFLCRVNSCGPCVRWVEGTSSVAGPSAANIYPAPIQQANWHYGAPSPTVPQEKRIDFLFSQSQHSLSFFPARPQLRHFPHLHKPSTSPSASCSRGPCGRRGQCPSVRLLLLGLHLLLSA